MYFDTKNYLKSTRKHTINHALRSESSTVAIPISIPGQFFDQNQMVSAQNPVLSNQQTMYSRRFMFFLKFFYFFILN
jgi:hypothetical protein